MISGALDNYWPRENGDEIYDDDNNSAEIKLKYFSLGRETKLARMVVFEITKTLDSVEFWIPKSVSALGENNTIWVQKWFVDTNELGVYEK